MMLKDIFGELSFLDEDLAASASVVTDGPVEVYLKPNTVLFGFYLIISQICVGL